MAAPTIPGGKASNVQHLLPGAKSTIVPGDPMSRSMGQYGKGHSYLAPSVSPSSSAPDAPAAGKTVGAALHMPDHPGSNTIRGGSGGMKSKIRPQGGSLGQGKLGMPAGNSSPDTTQDLE